jgi:hypothetical protein
MFDFRKDKTGFFVTVIMLALLGAATLATLSVLVVGNFAANVWLLKWVWGTWWVLCIITVLTRLAIFRWQMLRRANKQQPPGETPIDKEPSSS